MDEVESLISDLKSKDEETREDALKALIKKKDGRAVEPFCAMLYDDESARVRWGCAYALGVFGDIAAFDALVHALDEKNVADWDDDIHIAASACWSLGELGDRRAVDPICRLLDSQPDAVSMIPRAASTALGELGDPRAVPCLLRTYEFYYEDCWDMRIPTGVLVADALGMIADKSSVKPLTDFLGTGIQHYMALADIIEAEAKMMGAVAEALGNIGEQVIEYRGALLPLAVERLFAVLDARWHDGYQARAGAAWSLGKLGPFIDNRPHRDDVVNSLMDVLAYVDVHQYPLEHWEVRANAAEALGEMGDERALPLLIEALDEPVWVDEITLHGYVGGATWRGEHVRRNPTRKNAVLAIGKLPPKVAVEPLVDVLWGADRHLAVVAASALCAIGNTEAGVALKKFLDDSDTSKLEIEDRIKVAGLRMLVTEHLMDIGDPRAVPALIRSLDDKFGAVREAAASALGFFKDERAFEPLVELLERKPKKDDFADDRAAAAWALGEVGQDDAVEPLVKALEDKNADVRLMVVYTLCRIFKNRPPKTEWIALDPLANALSDEDEEVQAAAREALSRCGPQPLNWQGNMPDILIDAFQGAAERRRNP